MQDLLKSYFANSLCFTCLPEISPVPIPEICANFICEADHEKFEKITAIYLEAGNLQLEQNKIPFVCPVFWPNF